MRYPEMLPTGERRRYRGREKIYRRQGEKGDVAGADWPAPAVVTEVEERGVEGIMGREAGRERGGDGEREVKN